MPVCGVLKKGFQQEAGSELGFREWMNGQEQKGQTGSARVFLAKEIEHGIKPKHVKISRGSDLEGQRGLIPVATLMRI